MRKPWTRYPLARQSLLVRNGKGGKARRQPLPTALAGKLRKLRNARQPEPTDPVFCGLAGGRLQETILADIIRRAAKRAGIEKHVTAHTLRHAAATWLRQERGDTRLVAEYLGHSDLSTVSRYHTSTATSSSTRPAGWSSSPRQARAPTSHQATRSGHAVAVGVAGGAAAVERPTGGGAPWNRRLTDRGRRSQGRRTALSDPNSGAEGAKCRNRPLRHRPHPEYA